MRDFSGGHYRCSAFGFGDFGDQCIAGPLFGDLGEIVIVGTGGSGEYEYALNDSTQTQTDSLFSGLLPGIYEVFLLDGNGCVTSQEIIIDAPPSALEILAINVLPAPCFW